MGHGGTHPVSTRSSFTPPIDAGQSQGEEDAEGKVGELHDDCGELAERGGDGGLGRRGFIDVSDSVIVPC